MKRNGSGEYGRGLGGGGQSTVGTKGAHEEIMGCS